MYGGGSSKLGRLGGGGGRKSFPLPPPPNRPSSSNRLSLNSNPRGRSNQNINNNNNKIKNNNNNLSTSAQKPPIEESFSLVTGNNPLAFGMIIRLAPDLLEEIRRVEALGGTAKMKFDSIASNTSGNVINVGSKDFKFTWSREMGDLCDIYEERQTGEDGHGLLVESGSAWRKLSVQRILDESTTNHVKMRSEEAERKNKSRKAIVLEPGNPSTKSQMKALAAAETNPRKMFNQKKDPPFKKRKVDSSQGSGPLVFSSKTISSTTPSLKARLSASPRASPPPQSGNPASPFGHLNATKNQVSVEDAMPTQVTRKENISSSEKEIPSKAMNAVRETPGGKGKSESTPTDLRSMLISLLMENPKGMSPKALEMAVGNTIHPLRKIEPILKKIATFQAPGRYILKKEVEWESLKKPLSESGSPAEDKNHNAPSPEDNLDQTPVPDPRSMDKSFGGENQEEAQLHSKLGEENNLFDKDDTQHQSPDLFSEKGASDKSEGQAASSSNSGSDSDSDSDSSDSGSDSSSDSESDASSNSKEGSDEDVDIMSDDDKEPKHKLEGFDEKQDEYGSIKVEVEKILPDDDQGTELVEIADVDPIKEAEAEKQVEEVNGSSINHEVHQEHQNLIETLFNDKEDMVRDEFKHEQSNSSERVSDGKYKRGYRAGNFDEKSEHAKRLKSGSLPQPPTWGDKNAQFSEAPHYLSPGRHDSEPYKGFTGGPSVDRLNRDVNAEFGVRQLYNQANPGNSTSDSQQLNQRRDNDGWTSAPDMAGRQDQGTERFGHGPKYSERSTDVHESVSVQKDKAYRENQDENGFAKDEKEPSNLKEGRNRSKHSMASDSQYKKYADVGKFKEAGEISKSHITQKDDRRSPINGRDKMLQRELSDLELGELRDTVPQETSKVKKQFEKSSFKQSETKPSSSDNWNLDIGKGRPIGKATLGSGKPSPSDFGSQVLGYPEGVSKKRTPEHYVGDLTRSQHRTPNSQPQLQPKIHRAEVDKGAPVSAVQHNGKSGQVPIIKKQKDMHRYDTPAALMNGEKDIPLSKQKRRESSSDENSCLYYKYEKDAPDLKGPIKDISQYKEYVQEYRVKYDSYYSLNNTLESDRDKFVKLGEDLEKAQSGDKKKYRRVLGRLKDSYRRCGERHKRLKRIFVVLHKELEDLKQRIKEYAEKE